MHRAISYISLVLALGFPIFYLISDPLGVTFFLYLLVAAPILIACALIVVVKKPSTSGPVHTNAVITLARRITAIGLIILLFFFGALGLLVFQNF